MGERTTPIKFGPEWLRNMAPERSIRAGPGAQGGGMGAAAAPPGMGGTPLTQRTPPANPPSSTLPILARLRYGREEMLALYDRQTAEAPAQLKSNDILYVQRGQPPYALLNSFEEDSRDSMNRPPPPGGVLSPNDRYVVNVRGRGSNITDLSKMRGIIHDPKVKPRVYNRPTSAGRGWHANQRAVSSGIADDDPNQSLRPWSNTNHQTSPGPRPNNGEQPDWQTKQQQYRMKRQTSTNWRQQQSRDEGEEWRSSDGARRPQDKWEWGWQQEPNNRPNQDKQWHNNRRTWVGGDGGEDSLPEWAVDNAEACGGTFDSSGAFHGYSNDDSNLPKTQETAYPLTKSHTHGSFSRSKSVTDTGYEEWWASEKAKKLSPKRFDASEIQLKKQLSSKSDTDEKPNIQPPASKTPASNESGYQNTGAIPKRTFKSLTSGDKPVPEKHELPAPKDGDDNSPEGKKTPMDPSKKPEKSNNNSNDVPKATAFDSHANNEKQMEKGNIKSVTLTSNNNLRQKHQNIVVTPTETPKRQPKAVHFMESSNKSRHVESDSNDFKNRKETESNKIVEDILQMSLDDGIPSAAINQLLTSHSNSTMDSSAQVPYPSTQMRMASTLQGLNTPTKPSVPHANMQTSEAYNGMKQQPIGITNSMLNASLGLPMPNSNTGLPQGIQPSLSGTGLSKPNALATGLQGMVGGNLQQPGLQQGNIQAAGLQSGQVSGLQSVQGIQGLQGFGMQSGSPLQSQLGGGPNPGLPNTGLPSTGPGLQSATKVGFPNAIYFDKPQSWPSVTLGDNDPATAIRRFKQMIAQQQISGSTMYNNLMNPPPPPPPVNNMGMQQLRSDQWYYEDPNKTIQGPFSSTDMYNWYVAGFFNPALMVRRECDAVMSPLGSYGPMPFRPVEILQPFMMSGGYDLPPQQSHDNMMKQQPGLGIDMQALWGQPANNASNPDHLWMQGRTNAQDENPINNLPLHFWDGQPPDMPTTQLLPDNIKTEEEILAQVRAAPAPGAEPTSPLSFFADSPVAPPEADTNVNAAPNVTQLQTITQKEAVSPAAAETPQSEIQVSEKAKEEKSSSETTIVKANKNEKNGDAKSNKEISKADNNKSKNKETAKTKSKKVKEEKKEEFEAKPKEEEIKVEKRSAEPSPSPKIKKEDKSSKKDSDKEKKEWIKEGFTIVKGAEKTKDKDSKKKVEEAKAVEDAERKRKEEEKLAAEEKKRQFEAIKKQQEALSQSSGLARQAAESVAKKAPWLASTQVLQSSSRDGPTLAEIQRLEREKKLEQIKEQQHMMQIIAQQQAAALAREQEMQTGLGWAKKTAAATSQTLTEIQAEARKLSVAAAAAAAAVAAAAVAPREEAQPTPPAVAAVPWANVHNGGGFWEIPQPEPVKPVAKPAEVKAEPKKKKVTVMAPPKPENTPSVEFDLWCTNMLVSWRDTGIDVPTFVSFLKDIESPYEVKDYVKCYLGESREAGDFARQFLEKRSRLMRVGMVTPSDDLCSPAVAVNPRTNSGSDHADIKAKGKKTKKNKMLKVDARNILGFSVTASEDRINVGDIDTV